MMPQIISWSSRVDRRRDEGADKGDKEKQLKVFDFPEGV
jgi:hypothetical protein